MPTTIFSCSSIVSDEFLARCSLPEDLKQLEAATVGKPLTTGSDSDWCMSYIHGVNRMLGQSSLDWLSMEGRAAVNVPNTRDWWYIAVLDAQQIEDSLRDFNAIIDHAGEKPGTFYASADDFRAAFDLHSGKDAADFEIPFEGDVGQYPYPLHVLFAYRRFLGNAIAQRKPVVHLIYRP